MQTVYHSNLEPLRLFESTTIKENIPSSLQPASQPYTHWHPWTSWPTQPTIPNSKVRHGPANTCNIHTKYMYAVAHKPAPQLYPFSLSFITPTKCYAFHSFQCSCSCPSPPPRLTGQFSPSQRLSRWSRGKGGRVSRARHDPPSPSYQACWSRWHNSLQSLDEWKYFQATANSGPPDEPPWKPLQTEKMLNANKMQRPLSHTTTPPACANPNTQTCLDEM